VTHSLRQFSLLPEREAEQCVRLCVFVIEAKRRFVALACGRQIPLGDRILRAPVQIVGRARRRGRRLSRGGALPLQRGPPRIIGFAHL
jgi:hypothetical protein